MQKAGGWHLCDRTPSPHTAAACARPRLVSRPELVFRGGAGQWRSGRGGTRGAAASQPGRCRHGLHSGATRSRTRSLSQRDSNAPPFGLELGGGASAVSWKPGELNPSGCTALERTLARRVQRLVAEVAPSVDEVRRALKHQSHAARTARRAAQVRSCLAVRFARAAGFCARLEKRADTLAVGAAAVLTREHQGRPAVATPLVAPRGRRACEQQLQARRRAMHGRRMKPVAIPGRLPDRKSWLQVQVHSWQREVSTEPLHVVRL